ncbi:NAD+ diphosphatase [Anaerosolibacter carboniphilus]|uniref:NAD-capped RNA hydrolase NudC n=1 Tax=Anaerosolibacter carboniphilus TaxID=1417629 RepID=A0A841KML3_9FIRM|nr:NAD(+) diphosphatase [Anaerosolibacter carboniphilus]MBB6214643.1 NAD+ diphosphatase [Anaerosolibacter carboniphilus]
MNVFSKPEINTNSLWFVFHNDRLLIKVGNEGWEIPTQKDLMVLERRPEKYHFLGKIKEANCFSAELSTDEVQGEHMIFVGLRELFGKIDEALFWLAGKAIQIVNWDKTYQFCGQCGSPTVTKDNEFAKLCPVCGLTNYPRISPAIIVAVVKDDQILLAQSRRFTSKFYSVLAGFVEPGETLEECVKREVKEESGIEVKNISYFGSQPWPFPNSLMVAFTADYAGGEIKADEEELVDAKWFSAKDLPQIPGSISIARKLIDWFIETHQ